MRTPAQSADVVGGARGFQHRAHRLSGAPTPCWITSDPLLAGKAVVRYISRRKTGLQFLMIATRGKVLAAPFSPGSLSFVRMSTPRHKLKSLFWRCGDRAIQYLSPVGTSPGARRSRRGPGCSIGAPDLRHSAPALRSMERSATGLRASGPGGAPMEPKPCDGPLRPTPGLPRRPGRWGAPALARHSRGAHASRHPAPVSRASYRYTVGFGGRPTSRRISGCSQRAL